MTTAAPCERPRHPVADRLRRRPLQLPLAGLLALSTSAMLILVTELLPVGLLPQMSRSLGVPEGRVGFLATAYAAAATVGAVPLTALTRGRPRRPLLLGLVAGFAVVNLLTAASSSYLLTLGVRIAGGLLGGIVWSMLGGYAARMVPEEQRGRAIAVALSGVSLALAAGLPAGTALAAHLGWRAAFAVLAALAVGLLGWARASLPALDGEHAGERSSLRELGRRPGVRVVLGVTALLVMGHQMAYTYLAPLARADGIDSPGPVLLVFGASALAGIWLTGVVADRHLRAAALGSVGLVFLALLAVAAAPDRPVALLLAVALWGAAFGGAPTMLLTALIRRAGAENANSANSLQTTVYNVGVAGGSLIGGVLLDRSGVAALAWLAAGVTGAALLPVALGRSTFPRRGRPGLTPR
jgi:predicted MFS family arabinose efflux permease